MRVERSHRPRRHVDPRIAERLRAVPEEASTVQGEPACASARALGIPASAWTPEIEADVVPPMLMAVCDSCPAWSACLRDAVRMGDVGYRASTTTAQRRQLFAGPGSPVPTSARDHAGDPERHPRHPRGEGSLSRYRRGCRCDECRGHNAAARRRERARAS